MRRARLLIASALLMLACGPSDAPPVCSDAGAAIEACGSGPVPTYAELYATVLQPSCGRESVSCHGPRSDADLLFLDEETSRAYLLEHHVVAGSAGCSELYLRLTSSDPFFRMPPAEPVSETTRCAIARWIEAGAP